MIEWLPLLLRIQNVPGSNLGSETGCPEFFMVFSVSGYGLDNRAIEVRSPAEARGFFP
jgi:hypothetical protein